MSWTFSSYTVSLLLVAVLSGALAVFGWFRRPAPGAAPFAVVMLAEALFSLSVALEWAGSGRVQYLFSLLAWVGIVILPGSWAVLVAQCTDREAWVNRRNIALLCIEPIVVVALAATNNWHHLLFAGSDPAFPSPNVNMAGILGPAFVVHVVYSYSLVAGASGLLLLTMRRAAPEYRRQLLTLLLAVLAPWLADAMTVTGLNPFRPVPLTPFGFGLMGLATAWAMARLHFLDIVPVARDAIIDSMSDGMIALDVRNRIVYVNRAARYMIAQYHELDPIGRPITDFLTNRPDLVARFHLVNDVRAEVTFGQNEPDPVARREIELGISPLRDANGRQTGRLIALHDITERKATEEALRRSEERYRRIVEAAQEGIWMVDIQGRTVFANQRVTEMLGYTSEELQGLPFYDFVPPATRSRARDSFVSLSWPAGPTALDVRFVRRDGADLWTIINTSPVYGANDELVGGLAMLTDITERKCMEVELRQHRDHLEDLVGQRTAELEATNRRLQQEIGERRRAERGIRTSLQEKEVLLKEVHHRVKNNLQVIFSLLYLQSRDIEDPVVQQMFRDSQNRVRSMALVHEQLYRSEDLARVDFGEYVRRLAAHLYRAYGVPGDGIKFTVDVVDALLGIDQAIPCGLIINELVSNALKHAFPTSGRCPESEIAVSLRPNAANRLTLTVHDNGVGFPEKLDWRATASLGLQLVNTLVRQLEAEIELNRDAGTEFRITLK